MRHCYLMRNIGFNLKPFWMGKTTDHLLIFLWYELGPIWYYIQWTEFILSFFFPLKSRNWAYLFLQIKIRIIFFKGVVSFSKWCLLILMISQFIFFFGHYNKNLMLYFFGHYNKNLFENIINDTNRCITSIKPTFSLKFW